MRRCLAILFTRREAEAKDITSLDTKNTIMSDNIFPKFWEVVGCILSIVVSVAMIWYIIAAISYEENFPQIPLLILFFVAFIMIITYASFVLFNTLFPSRAESCPICALMDREKVG